MSEWNPMRQQFEPPTLAVFLLARIGEDQALVTVESAPYVGDRWALFAWGHEIDLNFARMLAECEAKRRIVEYVDELEHPADPDVIGHWEGHGSDERWILDVQPMVLRLLALPYADHPDYREEWRP